MPDATPLLKRLLTPGALCATLCLALAVIGLWPFDFFPQNRVDLLDAPPGLRFRGGDEGSDGEPGGLAFTPRPLGSPAGSRSFSLELRLRCNREPRSGVPGILVLCNGEKKPFLFLGQWKSALIVRRFNTEAPEGRRWREGSVCNALTEGTTRVITVTSNGSECVLYVDGVPAKRYPRWTLLPERGSLEGHYLVLGNTPEAGAGWRGDILGVALYDRFLGREEVMERHRSWSRGENGSTAPNEGLFLCYEFQKGTAGRVFDCSGQGNDLLIPPHPRFATRVLGPLELDSIGNSGFIQDALINVLGFIPFGLFLCIFLSGRRRWTVPLVAAAGTLGGAALSLFIELVQSQIPVRTSSAADLMSNTLGAGLGAILFAVLLARRKSFDRRGSSHGQPSRR